jgi:hypothetical protein
VAIFLGQHEMGLWQKRETWFALDRQVQEERAGRKFPVVPILLDGLEPAAGFLFLNTWVDLCHDLTDPEALDALSRAVRGEPAAGSTDQRADLCPYRGLQVFHEDEAAFFCGREAVAEQLCQTVTGSDFVSVVGTSGGGKSSVVQAGLPPLLRRIRPPADTWDAIVFTPDTLPFHRLAAELVPLLELWNRRRGRVLTLAAYRASGGVEGALAQRADETYRRFNPEQQAIARRILLRLTQPGEGTEDTRRRATFDELVTSAGQDAAVDARCSCCAGMRSG